jgi:tellurite resistance protein TerC
MFSKLKYGLAIILSFIGLKMLIAPFYHIEASTSLLIVVGTLASAIAASLIWKTKETTTQ